MEIILNTYEFSRKKYGICFDTNTREFYVRILDSYEITNRYRKLEYLLTVIGNLYKRNGGAYYHCMYDAIKETFNSPAMAVIRALLTGE